MPRKPLKKIRTAVALPEDDDALVRLPVVLAVFPIGESSWHRGISEGRYPKGVLLGARTRAWRAGEIRQLLAAAGTSEIDAKKRTA